MSCRTLPFARMWCTVGGMGSDTITCPRDGLTGSSKPIIRASSMLHTPAASTMRCAHTSPVEVVSRNASPSRPTAATSVYGRKAAPASRASPFIAYITENGFTQPSSGP